MRPITEITKKATDSAQHLLHSLTPQEHAAVVRALGQQPRTGAQVRRGLEWVRRQLERLGRKGAR